MFLVFIFSIVGYLIWYGRDQSIDFVALLPERFVICGARISSDDSQYLALKDWMAQNQDGWENHIATPALGSLYASENMTVYVYDSAVLVSYLDNGARSQVIKLGNTEKIINECSSSESL